MRLAVFKQWLLVICFVLLLAGCSEQGGEQPQAMAGSDQGQAAPDFTLTNMLGQKVTLSALQGKVVILNFWATWCPPCKEEMPSMEMLYRKYKDQGLVILAVNAEEDGKELVENFLKKNPYTFPILLDSEAEVQNLYNIFRFPETLIIDRNGNIADRVVGAIDWTGKRAVQMIELLLNG